MADVLILGANSDIAHAVARGLAAKGYGLILASRDTERLTRNAADLRVRSGVEVRTLAFDALDMDGHADFVRSLPALPHGVVLAVGLIGDQQAAQADFALARRILDSNYTGCVSVLNLLAEEFAARGSGFIVGISSVAGDRGRAANYLYGSAKAGFTAYLSGLRNRLHKAGVQVLTVKPGYVDTKMNQGLDLPAALTSSPEDVARDILRALDKGRDVIYTSTVWYWIMLAIRHIPERLFKRMSI